MYIIYDLRVTGVQYAEISVKDNAVETDFAGTGDANKVQIASFDTNGLFLGAVPDHTNNHITIEEDGVYTILVSCTFSGAANNELGLGLFANNGTVAFDNVHLHRKMGTTGDIGSGSMSGLVSISAGDTLELWIWNEGSTLSATVSDVTLSIRK